MDVRGELVERLALRRREKLGTLSDSAYQELLLAVSHNPADFIDDPSEEAFATVCAAIAQYENAREDDDLLDDAEYVMVRSERLKRLSDSCSQALSIDANCCDALLCRAIAAEMDEDALLEELLSFEAEEARRQNAEISAAAGDLWTSVWLRPLLRVRATITRTCLDSARMRLCVKRCQELIKDAPADELGARFTCMLAYARLEDEDGLDHLDSRFRRQGSAWSHLAHVLMLYRLDRMGAARRALDGYARLCPGGAYVLLRPMLVDLYLPDRPFFEAGSVDEAVLAVHEADPVVVDTPDLIAWAESQTDFVAQAKAWADENDLDW